MKMFVYDDDVEGMILPEFMGRQDANQFDLSNYGAHLTLALNCPTRDEIKQISKGDIEIRMTCFPDALWMTFKFGTLEWNEAPFTPHLSKQADLINMLLPACSNLTIRLIDTATGRILYKGNIKSNEAFSAALRVGVTSLLAQEFDKQQYDYLCQYVQTNYRVEQIAGKALASLRHSGKRNKKGYNEYDENP